MKKRRVAHVVLVVVGVLLLSMLANDTSVARIAWQDEEPPADAVPTQGPAIGEPGSGSGTSAQGDADTGTLDPQAGEATSEVISGDLTVYNSLCVGFDCLATETFNADTIRLKENNLRIHFDDTSSVAAFPSNDWRITVNDQASGGDSHFSIDDVTGGITPFRIDAGAGADAIRIARSGLGGFAYVGISQPDPQSPLHIRYGDTPSVRLEQSGGQYSPQTWSVRGNETLFFVQDVTHDARIPFAIAPGTPSYSLSMADNGDVGLGTRQPAYPLHLVRGNGDAAFVLERTDGATATISATHDAVRFGSATTHTVELVVNANPVFLLDGSGNVTIDGLLTEASDRDLKENFRPVDGGAILERLAKLPISSWNFIADGEEIEHMGPVAQDFFAAFGLGVDDEHIAPMDANGVALAGLKELHELVQERDAQIAELQRENAKLENRLDNLEALVETLVAAQNASPSQ